jgi:hypothetical protein
MNYDTCERCLEEGAQCKDHQPPVAKASPPTEVWRCCHTRKCKWKGSREELHGVPHKEIPGAKQLVCPRCGNDEFYVDKP